MQFVSNKVKVKKKLAEQMGKALEGIGKFVVAEAQIRMPVKTGDMRRGASFQVDEKKKAVYVGNNVEYNEPVEFGTSKQEAQPHWRPAVNDNVNEINNIAKKHLSKVSD